ncbi:bromodomain-containing protein 7-like [Mizuhopecten yessoensis]|uniref:Bromodomain-containing protein 7 n=1 Tax=Mizuhopecten yessoensis TaxID=6573 RepID=A0A210PLK8_MIZYE|nr:bromodomain-containing protein 7-like [Mizuhopecten yessoensis]OWF37379.1 Bromodomain-containing protein 7 [Mizuhopecten yessoensis]
MGKKHKKHHKSERRQREVEPEEVAEPPSLKIVLKKSKIEVLESDSDMYNQSPARETSSSGKKHKHKKKKKKKSSDRDKSRHRDEGKSRKRHREETEEELEVSQEEEVPVIKRQVLEDVELGGTAGEESEAAEEKSDRGSATPTSQGAADHGVLRICLKHIHSNLQRKDANGFFANPVNDMIAPGYSLIILNPMDFSTMLAKINTFKYRNVMEYKKDFVLMCNNAMTYNRPETIYYKEAKKLLHIGIKMMCKEKLLFMKRTVPFLASLRNEELGIDEPDETREVIEAIQEEERQEKKRLKAREGIGRYEALPDNMTPEEILAQAKAAAKDAADMLTLRKPDSKFGFLRQRDDGSTSLNIMNPENDGTVSETERVVNLGSLIGKLTSGTGSLSSYKEDKRNKVTPITYLNYGPFSSYAPQYDSTFSNISKEESDLLLSTYGDETGVQYARSIMNFTGNSGDYAVAMVDNLLDILTKGEHSKTQKLLEEQKSQQEIPTQENGSEQPTSADMSSLRSLSQLGVDVSFLDHYESEPKKDPVQEKLDQTASLLNDLQQTQNERLSSRLPPHLSLLPGPSEKEIQLAQKVTKELKELAKSANPRGVVSAQGVRSAMGVNYPLTGDTNLMGPMPVVQTEMSKLPSDGLTDDNQIILDDQDGSQCNINDNDSEDLDISEFLKLPAHLTSSLANSSDNVLST